VADFLVKQIDDTRLLCKTPTREEDLPVKHGALRDQVRARIQSASKLIVIWGTASANSQWVKYEIGLADVLGKPIIAVIPPKSDLIALPANLQNVQVVKL
jgi:hypothetical protein